MTTPRARSPYLKQTSTLKDLEPDTDNDIIDVTDYSERPINDKRSPRPKQTATTHTMTQGHYPTPQNSSTYIPMNAVAAAPAKPHRTEIQGPGQEKSTLWMASMFKKSATQGSIQK